MPAINLSEETYKLVAAFKPVVEAVIEEEVSVQVCAELILGQGINSMLSDIVGEVDQPTMLRSFRQLGERYPEQVYGYVAETLKAGAAGSDHRHKGTFDLLA